MLIATDVPFWRKSTGAQARIASMVRFLESEGIVVKTFFLGQSGTEQFTDSDRDLIVHQRLDIDQQSSDQPPKRLAHRMGWYADATLLQLGRWLRSKQPQSTDSIDANQAALKLDDFRWPWARKAFAEAVAQFKPNTILVQYIKLGYLLNGLPEQTRNGIKCFVDTHDVLHLRNEQFRRRGYQHWIDVSREEESFELKKFDAIIAIRDDEAELFRDMAPDCEIVVCGHATDLKVPPAGQLESGEDGLTIGYLGSLNASNTHAIESFLEKAWRRVQDSDVADRIKLVIAGEISDWLESNENVGDQALRNVRLLGKVANLRSFYDLIDLAINPVEFGTGLKIKNCEAIAFGKPLLTTTHGILGMPAECGQACLTSDLLEDFAPLLTSLSRNPERLRRLRESATQTVPNHIFGPASLFTSETVVTPSKMSCFPGRF